MGYSVHYKPNLASYGDDLACAKAMSSPWNPHLAALSIDQCLPLQLSSFHITDVGRRPCLTWCSSYDLGLVLAVSGPYCCDAHFDDSLLVMCLITVVPYVSPFEIETLKNP
jgi:hypothetical protein